MLNNSLIQELALLGIPVNFNMPEVEAQQIRSDIEVGGRIVILSIFYAISQEKESITFFNKYIQDEDLEHFLTNRESTVLNSGCMSEQDEIDFSWNKESVNCLCWCAGLVSRMNLPIAEIDISSFYHFLPPEVDLHQFIKATKLIYTEKLLYQAEFYYRMHWALRHPEAWIFENGNHPEEYKLSIVVERRKSLEWVLNSGLQWDDISLDT
ncbi:MAG: DUF4272 domain-containing protein [Saprospiraceae bacterium]|nr:DUF4272 domain-containing protein [Saprospiraceae bacterium]